MANNNVEGNKSGKIFTKNKPSKKILVIALVIVVLLIAGIVIYNQFNINKQKDAYLTFAQKLRAAIGTHTFEGMPPDDNNLKGDASEGAVYNFDFNVYEDITSTQKSNLDTLVSFLKNNPNKIIKVILRGHTDNVGSKKYNQMLSEKRCSSIEAKLLGSEILIEKKGKGMESPLVANSTPEGQAKNRRVHVTIRYKDE